MLLPRRQVLAGLIAAPAVLRLGLHMPIRAEVMPKTLPHVFGETWEWKTRDEIIAYLIRVLDAARARESALACSLPHLIRI